MGCFPTKPEQSDKKIIERFIYNQTNNILFDSLKKEYSRFNFNDVYVFKDIIELGDNLTIAVMYDIRRKKFGYVLVNINNVSLCHICHSIIWTEKDFESLIRIYHEKINSNIMCMTCIKDYNLMINDIKYKTLQKFSKIIDHTDEKIEYRKLLLLYKEIRHIDNLEQLVNDIEMKQKEVSNHCNKLDIDYSFINLSWNTTTIKINIKCYYCDQPIIYTYSDKIENIPKLLDKIHDIYMCHQQCSEKVETTYVMKSN
jgi:uncharacterized protein with PIN domain